MRKITAKLHQESLEKLKPLIVQLVSEGVDRNKIVQTTKRYVESRVNNYYRKFNSMGRLALRVAQALGKKAEDSKAELIFYNLLEKENISFKFQYKIGPYRVDYLIGDDLVVELDGPLHNKEHDSKRDEYLRKMGYRVLRIPIFVASLSPEAVIKEIKEAT